MNSTQTPKSLQTPEFLAQMPEFLTVEETARILRVHPRTIRSRINNGLLPAKQMTGSKSRLIAKTDALAQLEDVQPARLLPAGVDPLSVRPPTVLDRLAAPKGRARALALLHWLGEQDQEEVPEKIPGEAVQEEATPEPLRLRRWNLETWQPLETE